MAIYGIIKAQPSILPISNCHTSIYANIHPSHTCILSICSLFMRDREFIRLLYQIGTPLCSKSEKVLCWIQRHAQW